jgi:alpha 1,3-glucosidase
MYFPRGNEWYDYHDTSAGRIQGGSFEQVPVRDDRIPLFVKAGSIIPKKLTKRASTKFMKSDAYSVTVYADSAGKAEGLLYIDDEESMKFDSEGDFALIKLEYANGEFSTKKIEGNRDVASILISDIEVVGAVHTQMKIMQPSLSNKGNPIRGVATVMSGSAVLR